MKIRARPPVRFHHPRLETLEQRLPPGDALLGLWFGLPGMERRVHFNAPLDTYADSALTWPDDQPIVIVEAETALPNPRSALRNLDRPQESTARDDGAQTFSAPGAATTRVIATAANAWRPTPMFDTSGHAVTSVRAASVAASVSESAAQLPFGLHSITGAMNAAAVVDKPAGRLPDGRGSETSQTIDDFGRVPLTFEANHGQTDARVDFIARTGAGTVFLAPTAAVFSITQSASVDALARRDRAAHGGLTPRRSPESVIGAAIHMQIVGANSDAQPTGVNRQSGIVNYFIGNDSNQWHANIPTFGGVQYDDVYPGIDLVYYGNNGQLEYDFIISPGADPNAITLNFAGTDGVEINSQGNLVVHTAAGDVVQQKPFTYQEVGGTRYEVSIGYVVDGTVVRFDVGTYDPSRPLVIDPLVMGYSTFLSGGREGIAVDGTGSAYVTGSADWNFPTTPGTFDTTYNGQIDAVVAKFNADGSGLVYATYLGGSNTDIAFDLTVDSGGNAYVFGHGDSSDFPVTPAAFDTSYNGGGFDAFVVKVASDGASLAFATYLGGNNMDYSHGIAVAASGDVFLAGYTFSTNFPTTSGAFDDSFNGSSNFTDVFAAKMSADGSALDFSTFLGGAGYDIAADIEVDSGGNVLVAGQTQSSNFPATAGAFDVNYGGFGDAFIVRIREDGGSLLYATYLGGSGGDTGFGFTADSAGNAYVTGWTNSSDFPTTPGAFNTALNGGAYDVFVAKVTPDGSSLAYGTFLGGSLPDWGYGIDVDTVGNAFVTGRTISADFPTTPDAFDKTYNGGKNDAYLAKLTADGAELAYATYLGGAGRDIAWRIAVDSGGSAYLSGETRSTDFPTTPGAFKQRTRTPNAFVTKFAEM